MASKLPAILVLADGTKFRGFSIGASGHTVGEVVFNTSMTGYQEIISDPSYAEQIISFTYPHIGNVGINEEDFESDQIHSKGIIIHDLPFQHSNFRSHSSLSEFLIKKNIIHLGYEDKIQAACIDASRWLKTNKQKFDVIFLDPPFDQIDYKVLIRTIYQSNVLNESGKVFLETNKHTELKLSKTLNILKEKTIGDVRLMILQ